MTRLVFVLLDTAVILTLVGVAYRWREAPRRGRRTIGLLAVYALWVLVREVVRPV